MSFERKMSCAVGKCGHCRIDEVYVCLDGPVFNYTPVSYTHLDVYKRQSGNSAEQTAIHGIRFNTQERAEPLTPAMSHRSISGLSLIHICRRRHCPQRRYHLKHHRSHHSLRLLYSLRIRQRQHPPRHSRRPEPQKGTARPFRPHSPAHQPDRASADKTCRVRAKP